LPLQYHKSRSVARSQIEMPLKWNHRNALNIRPLLRLMTLNSSFHSIPRAYENRFRIVQFAYHLVQCHFHASLPQSVLDSYLLLLHINSPMSQFYLVQYIQVKSTHLMGSLQKSLKPDRQIMVGFPLVFGVPLLLVPLYHHNRCFLELFYLPSSTYVPLVGSLFYYILHTSLVFLLVLLLLVAMYDLVRSFFLHLHSSVQDVSIDQVHAWLL